MTDTYLALEWVIGIGIAALLVGFGAAWLVFGGKKSARTKVRDLESQLQQSQDELGQYRSEVYGQFSETAEKFRALDKSYHDLHRQLAASSVALIGDQAAPLLLEDALEQQTGQAEGQSPEIVVDDADDLPIVEEAQPAATADTDTGRDDEILDEVVEDLVDPEVVTHDGAEDDSLVEVDGTIEQKVAAQRPAG